MITTNEKTPSSCKSEQFISPPKLGMVLRLKREEMGFSQKDVADRLHLKPHIINVLENENFSDNLPGLFVRGYVRSYAKLLKINELEINKMLSQLDLVEPTAAPKKSPIMQLENGTPGQMNWATMFIVLILLTMMVMWYNNRPRNTDTQHEAEMPNLPSANLPAAQITTKPSAPLQNMQTNVTTEKAEKNVNIENSINSNNNNAVTVNPQATEETNNQSASDEVRDDSENAEDNNNIRANVNKDEADEAQSEEEDDHAKNEVTNENNVTDTPKKLAQKDVKEIQMEAPEPGL